MSHARNGNGHLDLALLTDGLRAEREQGITIDVAHRYFATPRRRFILADTPGHEQYTRNMVTGASTAEVAIVLVDARHGVVEQTRRHAAVAGLLRVGHVVLAVNKMDLVDWSEEVFDRIVADFDCFASKIGLGRGDAAADERAARRQRGRAVGAAGLVRGAAAARAPRDGRAARRRAGRAALPGPVGAARRGARLRRARRPAASCARVRRSSRCRAASARTVTAVETLDGPLEAALAGQSVSVRLDRELDLSRGDVLAAAGVGARGRPARSPRTSAGSPSGRCAPANGWL